MWKNLSVALLALVLFIGFTPAHTTPDAQAQATAAATSLPTAAATATPSEQEIAALIPQLSGATTDIHDPVMIKAGDKFYVFSTGPSIPIHCSDDMLNWKLCGRVFKLIDPNWLRTAVPGVGDLWAPDISFWNGQYYLYYAASTFGSNRSSIGLVTNKTLDMSSPDYQWVDQGEVLASKKGDNFNAIDPNLTFDKDGQPWLAFGSFWSGIKMRKIDAATGKVAADDPTLYSLASRGGVDAIEGAFIVRRGDYYYLFVSFDFCCKGVNSDYKIMVGRSTSINGPYADRDGVSMLNGGGTLIYSGSPRWRGPGHNGIYIDKDTYWLLYHAYDADNAGVPTLRIEKLQWDDEGWPSSPSARFGL